MGTLFGCSRSAAQKPKTDDGDAGGENTRGFVAIRRTADRIIGLNANGVPPPRTSRSSSRHVLCGVDAGVAA